MAVLSTVKRIIWRIELFSEDVLRVQRPKEYAIKGWVSITRSLPTGWCPSVRLPALHQHLFFVHFYFDILVGDTCQVSLRDSLAFLCLLQIALWNLWLY